MEAFLRELRKKIHPAEYYDVLRGPDVVHSLIKRGEPIFSSGTVSTNMSVITKVRAKVLPGVTEKEIAALANKHIERLKSIGHDLEIFYEDGEIRLRLGSKNVNDEDLHKRLEKEKILQ